MSTPNLRGVLHGVRVLLQDDVVHIVVQEVEVHIQTVQNFSSLPPEGFIQVVRLVATRWQGSVIFW